MTPDPDGTVEEPVQEIGPFGREDVVDGFRGLADILEGPDADHLTARDWNALALLTIAAHTMTEAPPEVAAAPDAGMAARSGARPQAFAMGRRRPPYRAVRVR